MSRRDVLVEDVRARSSGVQPYIFAALLVLVGASTALPVRNQVVIGGYSLSLIVATAAAAVGWIRSRWLPSGYAPLALFLSFWTIVSSIAIWEYVSLYRAAFFVLWLIVIIPGLGSLFADRLLRNAYIAGFAAGVTWCVLVAATRMARGVSVFDQDIGSDNFLLGFNRNAVNLRVVILMPVLLAGVGPKWLVRVRWPILALSVLWILSSGGRAGLLSLVLVLLLFGLVQPSAGRRLRTIYVILFAGLLVVGGVMEFGSSRTFDRLSSTVEGERTESDDARVLLFRKATGLALRNPFFGVGYGKFRETEDGIVESGQREHEREIASSQTAHNTYAEFLADMGFPGFAAFVGFVLLFIVHGLRRRRYLETRVWLCSFVGLVLTMLFATLREPVLYCTIAVLMGTLHERAEREEGSLETAPALPAG